MNKHHKKTVKIYLRNVVEPQLIDIFGSSNNTSVVVGGVNDKSYNTRYFDLPNPVTKTIFLQEFFGEIFEISL